MRTIFHISHRFQSHPDAPGLLSNVAAEDRDRVAGYVTDRHAENFFSDEPYQFFVLEPAVELPHEPAVKPGTRGPCYYEVGELQSGKQVVEVARNRRRARWA
jgi:hypothetical protein